MRKCMRFVLAISLLLPTACATGAKLSGTVTPIRAGVQEAKEQSGLAFNKTNELAEAHNVKRILESSATNLREADFPRPVPLAEQEKWATAFGALDSYLQQLQKLVDPARAAATTTELDALAAQLRDGHTQAKLPGAAVAAFNTFAGALVQIYAEHKALSVMRHTDPAFNEVMQGMSDAVGRDDHEGLRLTVRDYYASLLSDLRADYATAVQKKSESEKREIIRKFVDTIDARDAQLRDLASLQSSLMALGQAHTAAARGEPGDALFWIQRISGWLDDAKKRAEAAAKKDEAEKEKEGETK
jgi:hypothetical protein